MKIGVITTSFPRWPGDAAGHFVASHVELLRRNGHHLEVIAAGDAASAHQSLNSPSLAPTALRTSTVRGDGGLTRITRLPSSLFFNGGAAEAIAARGLPASLVFAARMSVVASRRAWQWDAAVAHWLVPSALAALSCAGPVLAIGHGSDVHLLRRLGLLAPVVSLLLARNVRLVFVARELADLARRALPPWLHARFDAHSIVQPMGVDLPHFDRLRDQHQRPQDRPYALLLARLVDVKGIDLAITAIAEVRADLDLIIAGDGPQRSSLEHLARAQSPRIRFIGEVGTAQRDAWLAHAAVVLVPSRRQADGRSEGMPQVALEALAAGVPLLAAAVGGMVDLAPPARLLPACETSRAEPGCQASRRWATAIDEIVTATPARSQLQQAAARFDWTAVAAALWSHWMR
jgi:glycosyltransferase involved in cell wall biosynthesis